MGKLTNRQKRFIDEYLISWNASDAARRSGYTGDANTVGPRLLAHVGIKEVIHTRMEESAMKADENLKRIADQARINPLDFVQIVKRKFYDDDGKEIGEREEYVIDWEKLKERGHLVKGFVNTQYGVKVEFHDAQAALFKIGTALGALTERVDVNQKSETLNVMIYLPDNGRDDTGN